MPESSTMVYPSRQAVLTDDIFEDPKSEDMKVKFDSGVPESTDRTEERRVRRAKI